MKFKRLAVGATAAVLLATGITAQPAKAVTDAIGQFHAGCTNFSINLALSGTKDDTGKGQDIFRLRITDGSGKELYREDVFETVGYTIGSEVVNLPYQSPAVYNPIKFSIIDLGTNGAELGEVDEVTTNAPCWGTPTGVSRNGTFQPNAPRSGVAFSNAPLLDAPNGHQVGNLTLNKGGIYYEIYRSADSQWVGVYIGGTDVLWVPISEVATDPKALVVPPTRIFGNTLYATVNGSSAVSSAPAAPAAPSGVTSRGYLRVHSAPNSSSDSIGVLTPGQGITLIGRNAASTWLQVSFNGTTGWVSVYYVNLNGAKVSELPAVQ